jgi:hypothetical protein
MMELEVQKYLREKSKTCTHEFKNSESATPEVMDQYCLDQLEAELAIKYWYCENLDVYSLNYDQHASPEDNPIVRECRGLILEAGTWDVVSKSFPRFFNLGQGVGLDIEEAFDWESATYSTKADGTLIMLYHYKDHWNVATRGRSDASGPACGNKTFGDLFEETLQAKGKTFNLFSYRLNPDCFYSFEMVGPFNRQVVNYDELDLILIGKWNKFSLNECNLLSPIGTRVREDIPLGDFKVLKALVESAKGEELEGVVLKDKHNNRIKVKNPDYMLKAKAVSLATTLRQQMELLLSDNADDVYVILPEPIQKEIDELKARLAKLRYTVLKAYERYNHIDTQKSFALAIADIPFKHFLFLLRAGKTYEDILARQRSDALLETIERTETYYQQKETRQ